MTVISMTGVYFLSWIPQVHFLNFFLFFIIGKTEQYTLMVSVAKVKLQLIQNPKVMLNYELKKTHA